MKCICSIKLHTEVIYEKKNYLLNISAIYTCCTSFSKYYGSKICQVKSKGLLKPFHPNHER